MAEVTVGHSSEGEGGLAGHRCLPTQRLPFREGDQQARSINEADYGRRTAQGETDNKKPRVPADLVAPRDISMIDRS